MKKTITHKHSSIHKKTQRNTNNKPSITTIYNCITNCATKLRQNTQNPDGLLYWTRLKQLLSPISHISATKFLPIDKDTYNLFMSLPEKHIDGHGNTSMIEINHFLIQLVRIPHNEIPTIIKILQLAYNYGQYNGTHNKPNYKNIKHINTIHKFISIQNINKINQELQIHNINTTLLCKNIKHIFN